jgi:hypothetical protein
MGDEQQVLDPAVNADLSAEEQAAQAAAAEAAKQGETETPEQKAEREKAEAEATAEDKRKKQDAAWKRLQTQRAEYKARAELAERLLMDRQENGNGPPQKPTLEQFGGDTEKFTDALVEYKLQEKSGKKEQPGTRQNILSNTEEEAREKYPDYDASIRKVAALNVPDAVAEAIQFDDDGAEIKYYLAKNVEHAVSLLGMNERQVNGELDKIREAIKTGKATPKKHLEQKPLPKPVTPERGGGSHNVDESALSDNEYFERQRKKGLMPQ